MQERYPIDPEGVKRLTTDELRSHFLVTDLFQPDQLTLTYTHVDRVIIGGIMPQTTDVLLYAPPERIGVDFFLARREIGIINVGGRGTVVVDGRSYTLHKHDGLYIGMGKRNVQFHSGEESPARFYFISTPAHRAYPTALMTIDKAEPVHLGDAAHSNTRTIYKYIHPDGVPSCQLTMGLTRLEPNNMWNTMPPHTHSRRMEVYFYFDVSVGARVFHLMGEPGETRHIVLDNEQAVISPSWSIHAGMGTGHYTFIWAMAGENQDFSDMDAVPMDKLR